MIYLDNAATTRPNPRAVASAEKYLSDSFYNPSALYGGGLAVHGEMKTAREKLLSYVADGRVFELVFTSGGTEADNFALFSCGKRGNMVISQGEHAAVYASAMQLKNRGIEVRLAPLNKDGSVNAEKLYALVDEKTCLVSVVHVNNETGAINDIYSLAEGVKRKNPRCLFHSDGVQAFGKIPVTLTKNIDLYSVSAHKIGGIKGVGALIKQKNLTLSPLLCGGGQENGLRSGTENVFGIMAFAAAAEDKFASLRAEQTRVTELKRALDRLLDREIFTRISPEEGSPYILTISARGLRGEILQRLAEGQGVIVGTGSACSSKHPHSRVIQACGWEDGVLDGVLRLSFSSETTLQDVERAAQVLNEAARSFKKKITG